MAQGRDGVTNDIPPGSPRRSRRQVIGVLVLGGTGALLTGCGGLEAGRETSGRVASDAPIDFSARFAAFAAADEPNGDLAKVEWPAWLAKFDPEVKRLYEFQIVNGALMRYMPCFCGCGSDGHRNNRDCYIKAVNPDGSVVFDSMAPT